MTIPLSIERPAGRLGKAPGSAPVYRPLPTPDAANDPAARRFVAAPLDVPLPGGALRTVRYAIDADGIVARGIAAAVASICAVALLESVARLAALYA
jgi:hypothetical protein